jgi:hypothetical protein
MSPAIWVRKWLEPVEGTKPRKYRIARGVTLPDVAFPEVSVGLGLPEPRRAAYSQGRGEE